MSLTSLTFHSPLGPLNLIANDRGLVAVLWPDDDPRRVVLEPCREDSAHPVLRETSRQLQQYFDGARRTFDLPLAPSGTPFQRLVWQQLALIPFGETRSYGELAMALGKPTASRAVGAANGRNPLSIIVPCHRVIGSSGKLTGFAGGLTAKQYLLALEGLRPGLHGNFVKCPAPAVST